jgi:hypothetical protein
MAFIKFCVVTTYALTKLVIVRIANHQSVKSQIYAESDGSIRIYMITFSKNCFYVDNKHETETKVILHKRSFLTIINQSVYIILQLFFNA